MDPNTRTPEHLNTEEADERPEGLTAEEWARFLEYVRAHPYGDQDENGIDLSLLYENLKLTPTQRVERMRGALASVLEIERVREATRLSSRHRRA